MNTLKTLCWKHLPLLIVILFTLLSTSVIVAQDDEPIIYYQMEPLDDSLFIHIQEQLFIDPPDPKAEIIVDLRNENDQTISIKGSLYPLLALAPETRARIITYPFKLNLAETIHFASVFTRVVDKIRFNKVVSPPTRFQISSTLGYINPYLQLLGGERFGWSLKQDVGLSFGIETEYSGPLETNYMEAGFHILGFYGGLYSNLDAIPELNSSNGHNNLYVTEGFRVYYVLPFGNFFEIGFISSMNNFTDNQREIYLYKGVNKGNVILNPDGTIRYQPYLFEGDVLTWEFRYPLKVMGSTRSKVYVASFLDETHIGFIGREMALAGSVFDFRFDAMVSSPAREPQYVFDIIIQKIFDYWAFSSIAIGPSAIMGTLDDGSFGFTTIFLNFRIKVGTSL
ncbi:MAG: hypothetical protein DRQ13_08550 [Ignavibacteriae bacterium]|nr:MAG: hypothetical protein DRQ13_08550 [Ignavibacteriota bacterium]